MQIRGSQQENGNALESTEKKGLTLFLPSPKALGGTSPVGILVGFLYVAAQLVSRGDLEDITDPSLRVTPTTGFSLLSSAQKSQSHTVTIATHQMWLSFPASELFCLLFQMASLPCHTILMKLPSVLHSQTSHLPPSKHCSDPPYSLNVNVHELPYQAELRKGKFPPSLSHKHPSVPYTKG